VRFPLDEDEVVNETKIARKKGKIIASTTRAYVPLRPTKQQGGVNVSPPDPPARDSDIYSDVEDIDESPAANHHERKGQSHSVSVCIPSCSQCFFVNLQVFRRCSRSGWSTTGMRLPMRS